MKEISTKKRVKVIKLYFEGLPYDEIGHRVGISKGSVANIIKDLREGLYPRLEEVSDSDQVEALRELAVAFRKLDISPWQAQAGASLFERLLRLGVKLTDVERWIKLCREIASPDHSTKSFVSAALELSTLEGESGIGYEAIMEEYNAMLAQLKELDTRIDQLKRQHAAEMKGCGAEIEKRRRELEAVTGSLRELHKGYAEQRRRLEDEMKEYLARHNLTLEQVELVARLAGKRLLRSGLSDEAIDSLMKQLGEAGSLSALLPRLRTEKQQLESVNKDLLASCNSCYRTCAELSLQKHGLTNEIEHAGLELERLKSETASLREERDKLKEDVDVTKAVTGIIANPFMVTEAEFWALIQKLARLWSALMKAKEQFPISDYRHPEMAEAVRHRLAELLAPAVEDQFVPRWKYDQCEARLRQVEEEFKALKG